MQVTIPEACHLLQPPIQPRQLRRIITALQWPHQGWKGGKPGHPDPLYDWRDISKLHAALTPWLGND